MDLTNITLDKLYDLHTQLCDAHHALHKAWHVMFPDNRPAAQQIDEMCRMMSAHLADVGARIDALNITTDTSGDMASVEDTTPSAPPAPKTLADFQAFDVRGNQVRNGDVIPDFRGDKWTFRTITRAPMPGKSAKVTAERDGRTQEFYSTVFDLTVR